MTGTEDTSRESDQKPELPWHASYPPPRHENPPSITRTEVLQLFRDGKEAGRDFVLVDLRRTDHEVGTHPPVSTHDQD